MSYNTLCHISQKIVDKRIANLEKRGKTHFVFHILGTGSIIKGTNPPIQKFTNGLLPDKFKIFDPFDKVKKLKQGQNVVDWDYVVDQKTGVRTDIPIGGDVEITKGIVTVSKENKDLLVCMMFSPNNVSVPETMKQKGVVNRSIVKWEERDEFLYDKSANHEVLRGEMLLYALTESMKDSPERKAEVLRQVSLIEKFARFNPEYKTSGEIANDFALFVREYPADYVDCNVTIETKLMGAIYTAMLTGVLTLDKTNAEFSLNGRSFCTYEKAMVEPSKEKEWLQKHLLENDGKGKQKNKWLFDKLMSCTKEDNHPYLPEKEEAVEAPKAKGEKELELA